MAGLVGLFAAESDLPAQQTLAELAQPMLHSARLSLFSAINSSWIAGVISSSTKEPVYSLSEGATAALAGLVVTADGADSKTIVERGLGALRASVQEVAGWIDQLDGTFALSIYDPQTSRGLLVNDHHGGVPIYMGRRGNDFVWASEVKSVHAFAGDQEPDVETLKFFLKNGYLDSERTYYKNIRQLGREQFVLVNKGQIDVHRVRDFVPAPEPVRSEMNYEAAKSTFKQLLGEAVQRRVEQAGVTEVTVTLSGGLDSRILAAEAHRQGLKVTALTYGQLDSPEIRIAASVAARLGIQHTIVPVTRETWMEGRADAVWATDGMMDFMHTHIFHLADHFPQDGLVLDGLFGDVVLGRGRIVVDAELSEIENRYLRVNRFTYFGPRIESNFTLVATPLIDKRLVQFMDGLDPAFTENSRLYIEAAAELYPQLFLEIPWHKTGVPPAPYREHWLRLRAVKFLKRLVQGLRWLNLPIGTSYFTMDYFGWMQQARFKSALKEIVYSEGGRLRTLVELPELETLFSRIPNVQHAKSATRILTLELWLRRVDGHAGWRS
ncbi:MAG: asparagine synthase-related protein [Pseudomonadota bacterium]